ncbi:NAD(P)/FAD-dependent oxidoreductase [Rubripirellula reticaptiva]|uniref:Protoporphyrinogen oxidase n=1 Tax=Rubripirellula reticaptiva TaxID=2528013 RepID=A0A5C6F6Z4_9BACT|nr:NAD(P)/FAD-dependent oxidoreductase [Rubripirellula reticaptiva]TWU57158.1 protoporphyrinogen oxidase [Rubripirellula reticaptiva]
MESQEKLDVAIIGGGLAGLTCAVLLADAGRRVTVLEATDRLGGRLRTDVVDGFTMNHGLQSMLTAYPACQRMLDYDALRLRFFEPSLLIRQQGRFRVLSDPLQRPSQAIATVLNPVGSLSEKLSIAKLRRQARSGTLDELYHRNDQPTIDFLQQAGFSQSMIDEFFRPFLGGIFLDESLTQSSRLFEFVFRMFAQGKVAVPADGMAAIPRQLADRLPRGSVRLQQSVTRVDSDCLHLSSGEILWAEQIVVATESTAAARLLGTAKIATQWNQTTTLYFAADKSPDQRKQLMLRGDDTGPVQTVAVMSDVAPEYSATGKALISISLGPLGPELDRNDLEQLDHCVRKQLVGWFGETVKNWDRLAVYQVPYALPRRALEPVMRSIQASDYDGPAGMLVCGDHCETPSIQGAMNSGIRVADAILGKA